MVSLQHRRFAVAEAQSIDIRSAADQRGQPMTRVQLRHPEPGRRAPRIDVGLYEAVRAAILLVLPREGAGMPFPELVRQVGRHTPESLWKQRAIGWYTTSVKLDLEARRRVERVTGVSPQRLRRIR
jgi:hypothetical protein